MLTCTIHEDPGVAVVKPAGPLTREDFAQLTGEVDAYLADHDSLAGLLIEASGFDGWEDFDGFVAHLRFIRAHHREIRRIAFLTDRTILSRLPSLADHFVAAEVRSFAPDARSEALAWIADPPSHP